jgi:polar amino acid transport system substrate-binding protein
MAAGVERKRGWRAAWLALALALWVPAAPAQEKLTIRVAVEGAYPPFNYLEQNELQGFEVDLLKALCAVMNAECIPVLHEWDGIVRGLLDRKYDAVMSSLEITERRKKRIAFSRRYYLVPSVLIARKDSAPLEAVTPEALAGKTIGAVDRSEHARYVESALKGAELKVYSKLEEANLDLLTERIDYVIGDKLALSRFLAMREGACCRIAATIPENPIYHGQGYAVGLRKEDVALKAAFDRAIEQVIADGTYDRIRAKYFPFDIK